MTRLLTPEAVSEILASRLRLLYAMLEDYNKSRLKPPKKLTREITELEARIYEESYATEIFEGG